MSTDRAKVVVTGASGLLGRQVAKEVEKRGYAVIGTAYSRASSKLQKLDLSDSTAVREFLEREKPQAIIHCAAEKRPDVAEQNQEAVEKLNAQVPGQLAQIAKSLGAFFVYISTDYVFDGTKPPYNVDDAPNPLNFYGRTKLAGEQAVLEANEGAAVLRVPVLYGEAEDPKESAVNVLLASVKSREKRTLMDDYQVRFPTNTEDVARVLADMTEVSVGSVGEGVSGIFHFSSKEQMTKYGMCKVFARILGLDDISQLEAVTDKPKEAVASRPDNTQLSTEALEEIGISVSCVPFEEWWTRYLSKQ
ncbi:methionine adenosyltransferase II, beta-like protein [Martensiomyces pterosporus]|nr:methionine adenosyltransferase II, beta-like protein [Martensiomyces pterosporus]